MEIAIPHTGKVVLRYLNETLQNQVFQIYFFLSVCDFFVLNSPYPKLPWGAAAECFFVLWVWFFSPFPHSSLSRLHRNRGTIITSDFDKCLGSDLNSSFNRPKELLTQILSYQDNFKTTSSLVQSHLSKSGQAQKTFFFFFFSLKKCPIVENRMVL